MASIHPHSDNSVLINDFPRLFTSLLHNASESPTGGCCFPWATCSSELVVTSLVTQHRLSPIKAHPSLSLAELLSGSSGTRPPPCSNNLINLEGGPWQISKRKFNMENGNVESMGQM